MTGFLSRTTPDLSGRQDRTDNTPPLGGVRPVVRSGREKGA